MPSRTTINMRRRKTAKRAGLRGFPHRGYDSPMTGRMRRLSGRGRLRPGLRSEPDSDPVFYGKTNDNMFKRIAPPLSETQLQELRARLEAVPGVAKPLAQLIKSGCAPLPLVMRVFVVALTTLDPRKPSTPTRFGGLTKAQVKARARDATSLSKQLKDLHDHLFKGTARVFATDWRRQNRLRELVPLLRAYAADLEAEVDDRLREPNWEWDPSRRYLYLAGLCDFVKEHTGKEFYGQVGELVGHAASLYDSSEPVDPDKTFSEEAIRHAVSRFRKHISRARPPKPRS